VMFTNGKYIKANLIGQLHLFNQIAQAKARKFRVASGHISKRVKSKFHYSYMKLYLLLFKPRHLSEQYFTLSQTFSHFLRHVKGLPQVAQFLVGRFDLATPRILTFRA
jgi:hypothetical protein